MLSLPNDLVNSAQESVDCGEHLLSNLFYADDIVILARSECKLIKAVPSTYKPEETRLFNNSPITKCLGLILTEHLDGT